LLQKWGWQLPPPPHLIVDRELPKEDTLKFILKRLGFYLIAFWAALTLDFIIPRMMPGDPATAIIGSMGDRATQAQIEALRLALGLTDAPLIQQYFTYIAHVFQGDFGFSYINFPAPVITVIATGFRWTLLLGFVSLVISATIGHLVVILGAWRWNSLFDIVVPPLFNFIGALPAFFLGLGIIYFFGMKLGWFPIGHASSYKTMEGFNLPYILSVLQHLALPVLTSVLVTVTVWTQMMRNSMISVLAEDYITMAEAKGLTQNRIMFNYGARNAILPSVTGFGVFLGSILGGQILIEQVFSYPGLGFLLVRAVGARDYPLMQGLFLGITTGVLVVNFLIDIVYTRIDPRIRG
jgi:peptide/nickel transport system permease protein